MNAQRIGKRLAELRGETSRERVASDLGISVSALGMYECGARIPRDETKIELAAYFGTTVGSLFFDEDCHETRHPKLYTAEEKGA